MAHSFSNGFSRTKRKTMEPSMYWGDGHNGILAEGKTLQAGVDFTQYEDLAVLEYERIHWDPDGPETLTVDQPCRGLIVLVAGPVYIGQNATISMAKKGSILPCNPEGLLDRFGASKKMRRVVDTLKTLHGGNGGNGGRGSLYSGAAGTGGLGRTCQGGFGGGGSGSAIDGEHIGGDGGSIVYPDVNGFPGKGPSGDAKWGGGGNSYCGSGNRHYTGGYPYGGGGSGANSGGGNGGDGEHAGGFILMIARSNVCIAGILDVSGGKGGSTSGDGGGGGGAGGGVVAVFAQGHIDTTSAVRNLAGGAGGSGGHAGIAGANGTYCEERL